MFLKAVRTAASRKERALLADGAALYASYMISSQAGGQIGVILSNGRKSKSIILISIQLYSEGRWYFHLIIPVEFLMLE